jgi:S1-C subfamily serine protease
MVETVRPARGRARPVRLRVGRLAYGIAVLAALGGLTACTGSDPAPSPGATGSPAAGDFYGTLPNLVERVEPSVVTVFTSAGLGSGVVYRDGNVIVTNAHVVGDEKQVRIGLADGGETAGSVLAVDVTTDLALIKAARSNLPVATFQQALPRQGTLVMAIGSPLGLSNTVTTGVVSGVGRQIPGSATQSRATVDLIQTDAAISPGNSGGALMDGTGKVVGVNEAYIPPQAGAVSLGFAIPAATVVSVADQLLASGKAVHPYLGIVPAPVTKEIAGSLGLPAAEGVLVRAVVPGGPAATAGIRRGDVVTTFNGQAVRTLEDLLGAVRRTKPGDRVPVGLVRGGATRTVTVTVGAVPGPP